MKIKFLIVFAFMSLLGFSQDPAAKKVLYKISPSQAKSIVVDEQKFGTILRQKKSVYSCEIDSVARTAIISVVDEKGLITKETFLLKDK